MMISPKATLTAASALLAGVALFSSCKGRTMENMEPTGDTVEVAVEEVQTESGIRQAEIPVADTAAVPVDTAAVDTSL